MAGLHKASRRYRVRHPAEDRVRAVPVGCSMMKSNARRGIVLRSRNLTWVGAGALVVVGVAVAGIHYSGSGTNSAAAAASSAADDLAALALPPPPMGSLAPPEVGTGTGAVPTSLSAEI